MNFYDEGSETFKISGKVNGVSGVVKLYNVTVSLPGAGYASVIGARWQFYDLEDKIGH